LTELQRLGSAFLQASFLNLIIEVLQRDRIPISIIAGG